MMIYWDEYIGHEPKLKGKRKKYDTNIYTFDIETTSYIILDGKVLNASKYLELTDKEKECAEYQSTMYIWMFGINDTIYYGRTYEELYAFLLRLEKWGTECKKICYVHNLSFEFQFLRNIFKFDKVISRKNHKVMKCTLLDFNIEFRCTLYMTNAPLKKLSKIYNLDVEKLVGNLNYDTLRHSRNKNDTEKN